VIAIFESVLSVGYDVPLLYLFTLVLSGKKLDVYDFYKGITEKCKRIIFLRKKGLMTYIQHSNYSSKKIRIKQARIEFMN